MTGRRALSLPAWALLVWTLILAPGIPVGAGGCAPKVACPMAAAGACAPASRDCAPGATWSVALGCCRNLEAAPTAPTAASKLAAAARAPAPQPVADASFEAGRLSVPAAPTMPLADRLCAERRHAVGLFTLFLALLN